MIGGCFQIWDFVIAQRAITKSQIERVQAQPAAPRAMELIRNQCFAHL